MLAQELLKQGKPAEALTALQDHVRKSAASAKERVFLFQLLSVLGRWDRALTQLNVAADLDKANEMMAKVCREALQCEALRAAVFKGEKSPLVFGEPEEWLGQMVQAAKLSAQGHAAAAAAMRAKALEAAPGVEGAITVAEPIGEGKFKEKEEAFEWVADADSRLGPMLEAVIQGKYYWIPMHRIRLMSIDAPTDLRDMVWLPVNFTWTNGGSMVGLLFTRYPGSESSSDGAIQLARKTDWADDGAGGTTGLGQRLLMTSASDYPILTVRTLRLGPPLTDEETQNLALEKMAKSGGIPGLGGPPGGPPGAPPVQMTGGLTAKMTGPPTVGKPGAEGVKKNQGAGGGG